VNEKRRGEMRGRARTLKDFRWCEIRTVGMLRFQFGMSVYMAARNCAIPIVRIRLIERAIMRAVRLGETDGLEAATVAAAQATLDASAMGFVNRRVTKAPGFRRS